MFRISSDLPPPVKRMKINRAIGRPRVFPWGSVEAGQNIFIPNPLGLNARSSLNQWKANHCDQSWISRAEPDGVRFWRTT